MRHEVIDLSILDYRRLTAEERTAVKRLALARAYAARRQALHEMLAGLTIFLRKLAVMAVHGFQACRARRARSIAAAELRSLSDHELKDIGVCRCEINALAFAGRA